MKAMKYVPAVILTVAACVWTYLVKTYDVSAIGPQGTEVGFSNLNMQVWIDLNGADMKWYFLSEILGYASLAVAGIFGIYGLLQLIKKKSLLKVDRGIIGMGILYVVMMVVYVAFEKIIVNYRPVIMPGAYEPEASYPSSHTMLVIVIMGGALVWFSQRRIKPLIKNILIIDLLAVMLLMVASRLLSGVHWFTDICGGVLIACALVAWYAAIFSRKRIDKIDNGAE